MRSVEEIELDELAIKWGLRMVEILKEVSGEDASFLGLVKEVKEVPKEGLVVCCGIKPPNWKGWKLRISHQLVTSPRRSIFVLSKEVGG